MDNEEEKNSTKKCSRKTNNNNKISSFVSIKEASLLTGIGPQTLRSLADNEKIPSYRTPSGQRKFDRSSLQKMCNPSLPPKTIGKDGKINFIYARVSSKKQTDDLNRQIEFLKSRKPKHLTFVSIQDIASGINFKRKGLLTILDSCIQGTIGKVVIAHRDRLARFAFELIQLFIERSGGELIILDDQKNKTDEQELSEDLLSIVHIYSCKQMGRRKYKTVKHSLQENQIETNIRTNENFERVDGNK